MMVTTVRDTNEDELQDTQQQGNLSTSAGDAAADADLSVVLRVLQFTSTLLFSMIL